uniref:C2 domain-containing protein n=2 Tax=Pectinophora gossypiella TaxID=13191 RepID=A0A1E1W180_PECGO
MNSERTRNSIDISGRHTGVMRQRSLWRPSSLANLVSTARRPRMLHSYHSYPSTDNISNNAEPPGCNNDKQRHNGAVVPYKESNKKGWSTIVTIVIVEAKGLPDPPSDGAQHSLYCKIRLGSETYNSKTVQSSHQPIWRERCQLHLNKDHILRVSIWDKGKQRNFMGSCVIDLGSLGKERAHDIWQVLDDGFGAIHLNVTMCAIRNTEEVSNVPSVDEVEEKFTFLDFNDWQIAGKLQVKVLGARGLYGKPNAYCTLELNNERVQTPSVKASPEPTWKKYYIFNVRDVTSTLEVNVYDYSLVSSMGLWTDHLGKVSIPLLRIRNGEMRWYALKDKNNRTTAKGNCPRVLLEMSLVFNPVKASLRLFRPVEIKYISKKPPKFHMNLVYGNLIFIRDTFNFLYGLNEGIKRSFEWENRELSTMALLGWLLFWYFMRLWTTPLLLLIPFMYFWINRDNQHERCFMRQYSKDLIETGQNNDEKVGTNSLTSKLQALPELTITITSGIEYLASIAERLYNLLSFKVPFLSYLTMIILVMASAVLYWIPFNFLMMALGVYKYTRKFLDPERILNNDLLDFISRIPDNEILKDWEELSVPEPPITKHSSLASTRTSSNNF